MKKILIVSLMASFLAGCATDEFGNSRSMTNTEKGAIIGVLGGAAAGAAIDHNKRGRGALIGAIGGGLAGGAVGAYMDSQAKDLQKQLAPEVARGAISIDKRADNSIKVVMTAATAFDSNSAVVKTGFHPTLNKIADVVNKYGKTTITIEGHTDSQGSDQVNQTLSERRAVAVDEYLQANKVAPQRLTALGRGEKMPVADNGSEAGRARNRRVELLLEPVVGK
ncbi:MAG: hypothetical protein H6R07_1470 [Proteobacteria bacterium]|nr:hypothetical protein [Pseudomonadota bacterium]